jgi:RNA polymerase sigma factor (sigma-70 family)
MSVSPWWTTISTTDLLELRARLIADVGGRFASVLEGDLEDIVQHAFVVLFQRRVHVSADNDGLYRYLRAVAVNSALDRVKTSTVRRGHLPDIASAVRQRAGEAAAPRLPQAEENEKVWRVFCALEDLDRLILWGYAVDGRSIRSLARDLGLNWHRVATILERTLSRIRRELEA